MKAFFFVASIALFTMVPLYGQEAQAKCRCRMPDADHIKRRVMVSGFSYFAEKTDIIDQVASQELDAMSLLSKIENAAKELDEKIKGDPNAHENLMSIAKTYHQGHRRKEVLNDVLFVLYHRVLLNALIQEWHGYEGCSREFIHELVTEAKAMKITSLN